MSRSTPISSSYRTTRRRTVWIRAMRRAIHSRRGFLSGSSLAAAHVAGVVALLLEERSRLTAGEALDVLRNTRHALRRDVREPAREVALVDACAALAQLMGVASCP